MTSEVEAFLASWPVAKQAAEARTLAVMMKDCSGEPAVLWPGNIIGFGTVHYKYASGREGDTPKLGFALRKGSFSIYGVIYYDHNGELLDQLGSYTRGKGCLYIKSLQDVDLKVLKKMFVEALDKKANSSL